MPRSRARPKRAKSRPKVRQRSKGKKTVLPSENSGAITNSSHLSKYDVSKSQYENYKDLGLLADANQIGAVRGSIRGFKPRLKGPTAEPTGEEHHPLEDEVAPSVPTCRPVPAGERKVLQDLVSRHGDDYAAMERDMRLNTHQKTAPQLRRRIAKMRDEDSAAALAASEAEAAGAAAPVRQKRKRTKNPNRAFKRRSTHFC
mmetsp:Transcript_9881/g.31723  ORF Transcript_9881/g.31723 Transcript_9881/m.31723 type:complete len:201 (+) Transcript_9881:41-643(+)